MHSDEHTSRPPPHASSPLRHLITGWATYFTLLGLMLFGSFSTANAQNGSGVGGHEIIQCAIKVSLDGRLVMQQWVAAGSCERPFRTRVIDQFLGFTCVELNSQAANCRSFIPTVDSRGFDSSRVFRCVDIGVTDTEYGVALTRMREWVAPEKQCDWNPYLELLAMEVDFANAQVCIAGLCMQVDRLSSIGKLRLRQLIEKTFRDLDLTAQAFGPHPISPIHVQRK
jgi:hypothetical protein